MPRTPKVQAVRNSAPMENRVQAILNQNNTKYRELFDSQKECNPHFSFIELHFWALSKQRYHPNTAYRSLGDRPRASDLFAKISCPTLILKADDQAELGAGDESVASNLKSGELVRVEDASRCVQRDQPERFHLALNAFLSKL